MERCAHKFLKTVSREVYKSSYETFVGLRIHFLEELDCITKRMQSWSKVLPMEIV